MLHTLARRDLMPDQLRRVALLAADPEWVLEADRDEGRRASLREYIDLLVVAFPVYVCPPGADEWERVAMTVDDLATTDQRDLDAIGDVVLRLRTPEQVSAASRLILGLPPEPGDEEVSIPDLATFRGEPDSAPAGDDSAAVGADPEPVAGAVG